MPTSVFIFILSFGCILAASPLSAVKYVFGDPPDSQHPWAVHDRNRPQPPRVEPGAHVGAAPSDAIVLFDGTEASFLQNWIYRRPKGKRKSDWIVGEGVLQCVSGAGFIESKEHFGDCQLHIEWMAPPVIEWKRGQRRGNSGVYLLGQFEVQILDSYNNPTYSDGSAGAVYGVMPPASNSLRGPGQWQSYDIIFRRPIVKDGIVLDEGSMTVLMNGVVVQDSTPLDGGGGFKKRKVLNRFYPDTGPLALQEHGNPVRFRNIWYRPLRPRPVDGGTDGRLSAEVTLAKRAEIASDIREAAKEQHGIDRAILLLESLAYELDEATFAKVNQLVSDYLVKFDFAKSKYLSNQKENVLLLDKLLIHLNKHNLIPVDYFALSKVNDIAIEQGWKKKSRQKKR